MMSTNVDEMFSEVRYVTSNRLLDFGGENKQETQPSLTNRTMHLCTCNGVAAVLQTRPSQ